MYRTPESELLAAMRPRVESGERPTETAVLRYEMSEAQGALQIYAEIAAELRRQNERLRAELAAAVAENGRLRVEVEDLAAALQTAWAALEAP